jgi:hypothetical protein
LRPHSDASIAGRSRALVLVCVSFSFKLSAFEHIKKLFAFSNDVVLRVAAIGNMQYHLSSLKYRAFASGELIDSLFAIATSPTEVDPGSAATLLATLLSSKKITDAFANRLDWRPVYAGLRLYLFQSNHELRADTQSNEMGRFMSLLHLCRVGRKYVWTIL